MKPLDRVEVYSSYAYAVEPRAFYLDEARHEVQVERAWKSPGRIHFNVRDKSQGAFELIYEETGDRWFLNIRTSDESAGHM